MLLRIKEAAQRYGIPIHALYRLNRSGKIKFVRLGIKRYRVDSAVLEKWISGK